uniref:Uncharacterized protein n=1 Tax=Oryza punctata TaxID=4537 RepID=A0A0E0M1A5_ORYPU
MHIFICSRCIYGTWNMQYTFFARDIVDGSLPRLNHNYSTCSTTVQVIIWLLDMCIGATAIPLTLRLDSIGRRLQFFVLSICYCKLQCPCK